MLSLLHHDHNTHHRLVGDPAVFFETSLTLFLLENSFSLNVLTAALFLLYAVVPAAPSALPAVPFALVKA